MDFMKCGGSNRKRLAPAKEHVLFFIYLLIIFLSAADLVFVPFSASIFLAFLLFF